MIVFISGCGRTPQNQGVRLTVIAPNYLAEILDKAVLQFYEENGVRVSINYENPDSVISWIKAGLRADLFLSNNPKRFEMFQRDTSLVAGNYSCPFKMSMVMVGRVDGPSGHKLDDLKQDKFRRVVVIDPIKKYEGKLAAKVLNRRGLWNKLTQKLIIANSPDHLHSYLVTKEADAAIMFESSIRDTKGLVILKHLGEDLGDRLVICGAVIPGSKNKEVAQAFLDLLDSRLCQIYKTGGIYQYNGR